MTNAETCTLVLRDQAGKYYLLPQETLERGRVPDEHKAGVERLMVEAAAGDGADRGDVQGHILPAILAGAFVVGFVGGFTATEALTEDSGGNWVVSFVQGHQAAIKGIK